MLFFCKTFQENISRNVLVTVFKFMHVDIV